MQFSYWEYNHFNKNQNCCIIIGSGIVGLSTAIEIKTRFPDKNVLIIEKYFPPQGASTKNAGFACFGSVTEILDDLQYMSIEEVTEIIQMRWQGIEILKHRLATKNVKIIFNGGKELFSKNEFVAQDKIDQCNEIMLSATGQKDYFHIDKNNDFKTLNDQCIAMKNEGQLDALEMTNALNKIALDLGVQFIYGHEVTNVNFKNKTIDLSNSNILLNYEKLLICTNGFTRNLLPQMDVMPARNHVLVTNEIKDLTWKGVYHFDKGYYYFRNIGNRILLGGARNYDPKNEEVNTFEFNEKIRNELVRFLNENIAPDATPVYWWTGILGVGASKYPILKEIEDNCYIGVRLGGMGVAIGSYLGKKLVDLAFDINASLK